MVGFSLESTLVVEQAVWCLFDTKKKNRLSPSFSFNFRLSNNAFFQMKTNQQEMTFDKGHSWCIVRMLRGCCLTLSDFNGWAVGTFSVEQLPQSDGYYSRQQQGVLWCWTNRGWSYVSHLQLLNIYSNLSSLSFF